MPSANAPKTTPLHRLHVAAGARMVEFGGWEMPVQFSGILKEHAAVRGACGIFDISHMGQFVAKGTGAARWLNGLLTNNIGRIGPGYGQYSLLLNDEGGVIDDLYVYQTGPESYLLVVNASTSAEDFAWMRDRLIEDVDLQDLGPSAAGIAIQGPLSSAVVTKLSGPALLLPLHNGIVSFDRWGGWLARTGYTGEDGFEIFLPAGRAVEFWQAAMAAGELHGLVPCGLGARDTLRLEMGYPLNGSDLTPAHSPLEAGLGKFVDLEKVSFPGRNVLVRQKAGGVARRLAAFRMTEKSPPPRSHCPVWHNGVAVGETTSASLSPSLGAGIGMAYVPIALATAGTAIEVEIRGRRYPASIEKKPLYKKSP